MRMIFKKGKNRNSVFESRDTPVASLHVLLFGFPPVETLLPARVHTYGLRIKIALRSVYLSVQVFTVATYTEYAACTLI